MELAATLALKEGEEKRLNGSPLTRSGVRMVRLQCENVALLCAKGQATLGPAGWSDWTRGGEGFSRNLG